MSQGEGGGRPTECNAEIVEKALDYADNYQNYGDNHPSIAGLSAELNINRSQMYKWRDNPGTCEFRSRFQDILAKIMNNQERVLKNKGLDGTFNSNITKLMLTKHGYSDKQELSGSDNGAIKIEQTKYVVEIVKANE